MHQGLSAKQANDAEQAEKMLAAAADFYRKAAEMYPPDDENFPCEPRLLVALNSRSVR